MKKLLLLFLLFTITSFSQNQITQFINYVNTLTDSADRVAAADSFMIYARSVGIPFIEENSCSFIYYGNVSSVNVAGDFNGWNPQPDAMVNLYGTKFWYKIKSFELNARLDYKLVRNGNDWILDPENPNTCAGGFGPNSELSMPEYIQPWEIEHNNEIEHGSVEAKTLFSSHVNSNFQIKIYLPPGYDPQSDGYPAVYFQDGFEYVDLAHAINVLDNLIDSNKIQKVIGVFVKPNNRNEEYAFSKRNQYRLFFANELVPFIDSLYNTIPEAFGRAVIGDSYGGNISALISYNHPEVFGNCGLHSAAFQPNNYEAYNLIINGPKKNIKFSSVWGTYESLFTNMRNFRDSLLIKGYDLKWLELPEGHSWGLWRATIDVMLQYFFPGSTNNVNDNSPGDQGFILYQNYPNPFNPSTTISWESQAGSWQTLKIFNSLGEEVETLVNEYLESGFHSKVYINSKLPSGVYFYKINSSGYSETKQMVLLK
jgi:enterochelin esterase family protein